MTPYGSTLPSTGSYSAPTKYFSSSSGYSSLASVALIDLDVHAEVAAAGLGHAQPVQALLGVGEHQPAGQVDAAVLAGLALDLLVELDRVLLQLRARSGRR